MGEQSRARNTRTLNQAPRGARLALFPVMPKRLDRVRRLDTRGALIQRHGHQILRKKRVIRVCPTLVHSWTSPGRGNRAIEPKMCYRTKAGALDGCTMVRRSGAVRAPLRRPP